MKSSRDPQDIASFLSDESHMKGGSAEEVFWPETAEEAGQVLAECAGAGRPMTVSGAGTGITGGRVPMGGAVLATDKLNRILDIHRRDDGGGIVRVQAGVTLTAVQEAVAAEGLWYPPDPTEAGCFVGGSIGTNASGARTFRFGPTRHWVERLRIGLPDGSLLELRRDQVRAAAGAFTVDLPGGKTLRLPAPDWTMPETTKHAAGYFSEPDMDLVDLFIGSEGTLGVILEADLRLLPTPRQILAGILFFEDEGGALNFVEAARSGGEGSIRLCPLALEFFDCGALGILREKGIQLPRAAGAAIFFEDAVGSEAEAESHQEAWIELASSRGAAEDSWVAEGPSDHAKFREFRHEVPWTINEKLGKRGVTKVSTDTAVPRGKVRALLAAYRRELAQQDLENLAFGHIGDDHLHINILPRDQDQWSAAKILYHRLVRIAVEMGGTTSAEHGLGKLKAKDLTLLFPPPVIERMRAIKQTLDPQNLLGRGTLFG